MRRLQIKLMSHAVLFNFGIMTKKYNRDTSAKIGGIYHGYIFFAGFFDGLDVVAITLSHYFLCI